MVRPTKSTEKRLTTFGPRPVEFAQKYRFIKALLYTRWSTALDHNIGMRIVERYKDEHGNGRVSLRYLETGTGASRSSIIASLRRLADNGALCVVRQGAGTRPTEYLPVWNFGQDASGSVGDTSSGSADTTTASGSADTTPSGVAGTTSKPSSGSVGDTESHLRKATLKGEPTVVGDEKDDAWGLVAPDAAFPLPKRWTIVAAEMVKSSDDEPDFVAIDLESEDGDTVTDYFNFDPLTGFEPDSRWDDLVKYAELLCEIGGTEDLVGVRVWAFGSENDMTYIGSLAAYVMLPNNDNDPKSATEPTLPTGERPWTKYLSA